MSIDLEAPPCVFAVARTSRASRFVERALPVFLDLACRVRFRVEARDFEGFARRRSMLVVVNHRSDIDAVVLGGVLLDRRGLRAHGILPYFVAREDLFRRGFVGDYLEGWPAPARRVLSRLDVSFVVRASHARPLRRVPERTLEEVLEDVLSARGNLSLEEVLRPTWLARFRAVLPSGRGIRLSEALERGPRELLKQRFGLLALTHKCFRAIKANQRSVIGAQLRQFAALLERGEVVQLAPEGVVSTDGRFGRIRLGLHALLEETRTRARVVPVGITYDTMASGRIPVFVNAGPELADLQGAGRRAVSERVTQAILAQTTVTASQLAGHWLRERIADRADFLCDARLLAYVADQTRRFSAAGARVDPRLSAAASRTARVADWLRYARRRRWLARARAGHRILPSTSDREAVLRFAHNELCSLRRVWPAVE